MALPSARKRLRRGRWLKRAFLLALASGNSALTAFRLQRGQLKRHCLGVSRLSVIEDEAARCKWSEWTMRRRLEILRFGFELLQ